MVKNCLAELLSEYNTQFISSIGYLGVFILMTLESAALPVPSEVVMPFSGYLAYMGVLTLITEQQAVRQVLCFLILYD